MADPKIAYPRSGTKQRNSEGTMSIDYHPRNTLYRKKSGRWALNDVELTFGDVFEVNIAGFWIDVRIEHDSHDYYAIPPAVRLYEGLFARFRREWSE